MNLINMKINGKEKEYILNMKSISKLELDVFKLHIAESFSYEKLMEKFKLTRQRIGDILFNIQKIIINFRKSNKNNHSGC